MDFKFFLQKMLKHTNFACVFKVRIIYGSKKKTEITNEHEEMNWIQLFLFWNVSFQLNFAMFKSNENFGFYQNESKRKAENFLLKKKFSFSFCIWWFYILYFMCTSNRSPEFKWIDVCFCLLTNKQQAREEKCEENK